MRRSGFGWWRRAAQVVLGGMAVPSASATTFTNNDWDLTADGVDDATLTLTLRDTTGALMTGRAVTFAAETVLIGAATCTVETDASEILTTTGTANITAHVYDTDGTPLPGIPAASLTLASTGSGNTITAVDTVTDRNGRFRWTFVSTSAATKTLSLTACGLAITDTAQVIVSAAPTAAALVFASEWNTTTGDTAAAVRDTGRTLPWEIRVGGAGNGASVVNAASDGVGTNCPTTNALRVDLVYVGGGVQNMDTDEVMMLPTAGAWATPAIGESVWFRVYKRVVYPHGTDPGALGNNNHCLEQSSGSSNSWSWNFNTASGGWNPSFNVYTTSTLTRFLLGGASPIYLSRDAWYRLEWRILRTGTDAREHEIRIYNGSGTLVYDETDFATSGGTGLSGYSAAFGTNGVAGLDALALGTNGPNVVGATQGASPAWYFAAAGVSVENWCGVYTGGEGP